MPPALSAVRSRSRRVHLGRVPIRVMANSGTKDRRTVPVPDQIGLLLRPAFVDQLEPVVDRDDRPVRPDRAEEWAVGDFLDPGDDRCSMVFCPMRAPPPADHVGVKEVAFLMEEGELGGWCGVVPLETLFLG